MMRRKTILFIVGFMCLAAVWAGPGFQKKSLLAYVESETILTGESARMTGYADAGKKIVVTPAGPRPPAAAETTAAVNRAFSVEIGPFEEKGVYTLTVTAEGEGGADRERTVVYVQVVDPPPDGRVIAQLAVVIIPTGSPVPIVQKYDTPFQPGWWHLTRALGEGGMTTLEITMDGEKRVVKKEWTRQLSTAGARGDFSIKVDLCAGCEDD